MEEKVQRLNEGVASAEKESMKQSQKLEYLQSSYDKRE